ncbi:ROK family protein [Streptomyces coffeae]|uniref:ROK family protein n=1 Tax=Streptomyces coffeae TaxID=621382 RepID=A0ABS1N9A4_9ACTN|nr:ROK family protein [Streptomyces coffeae]MBL1096648.1 ROK family protein [Streptomyces coffeae]
MTVQTAQLHPRTAARDARRDARSSVLWALYFNSPLSRDQLALRTGLDAGTMATAVGELLTEGVLIEPDTDPPRLRLVRAHRYVIGVDIGETRVRIALFDLALNQRAAADSPLRAGRHDADIVVGHILTGLDTVIDSAGVPPSAILGVGIGVSGVVEHGPDPLVHGQSFGWEAVPLERLLRAGTALPLFIDNGATAMGQAELWFGAARGAQHVVVALIGSGVGAGVITHGTTYRGATSSAGEWGHTTVQAGGRRCRCGARGCLEAYVGAEAVLERFRRARRGRPVPGEDEESAFTALLAAAGTSPAAQRVLEEAAVYLGAGVANLVNLFNPQRVILGGWAGLLFGARMLPRIRESVAAQALRRPYAHTTIALGRLGPDGVALGAATLPVRRFLADGAHPPRTPVPQRPVRAVRAVRDDNTLPGCPTGPMYHRP